jgi:hypothetical protein
MNIKNDIVQFVESDFSGLSDYALKAALSDPEFLDGCSKSISFHIKKAKDRLKNQILGETKIRDIIDGLAAAEPSEVAAVAGLLDKVDSLLNKK